MSLPDRLALALDALRVVAVLLAMLAGLFTVAGVLALLMERANRDRSR